ncbi:MAG: hypothetical protein FWC06_07810 [Treponema sp.]|nr:hypothetical protein [Treponema sp.]
MSGKGGNNRRNRQRFPGRKDESGKHVKKHSENVVFEEKFEKNRVNIQERPQWTAPVLPANPISTPDCPWCGDPIKDIATAICDKDTGRPVHFDCVLARIAEMESLGPNEGICYIGSGRFGVVHYKNPPETKDFSIRKIYEWESKDNSSEWRRPISEYYSIT